jgi:hypothetical protein
MAATTITTNIGRQLKRQIANGEASAPTSQELVLLQSAAISGGADVSKTTADATSMVEITTNGGYARKDISAAYATSGGPAADPTEEISSQNWTADGTTGTGAFDDFDMIAEVWTVGGTAYIMATWATAAIRTITAGSTYYTGTLQTAVNDA